MFLFLIITGAIYNTAFISSVGVCNDLLFWQIVLKKAHSSVLTSIKYSTAVKSVRHGSIHGTDAVTGKQIIPISSVLTSSHAQDKYTQRDTAETIRVFSVISFQHRPQTLLE